MNLECLAFTSNTQQSFKSAWETRLAAEEGFQKCAKSDFKGS